MVTNSGAIFRCGDRIRAYHKLDAGQTKLLDPDPKLSLQSVSYVTTNLYCKSRNLPNTDVRNYSIDLR